MKYNLLFILLCIRCNVRLFFVLLNVSCNYLCYASKGGTLVLQDNNNNNNNFLNLIIYFIKSRAH